MDLFLKFESEEQANSFLFDEVVRYREKDGAIVSAEIKEDGSVVAPVGATEVTTKVSKFTNIDIIGDIYKPTGESQEVEGPAGGKITIPVMEKLDGYHVNVRLVDGEDAAELQQFSVVPTNPVRVWA